MGKKPLNRVANAKQMPKNILYFHHKETGMLLAIADTRKNSEKIQEVRSSGLWEEVNNV